MKKIVVLRKKEESIINQIKNKLIIKNKSNEISAIENNKDALYELAKSISLYPSILGKQNLGNIDRSIDTLIENLCVKDVMDLILHTPTKAVLGKGFAVAKINFFLMLLYLSREIRELHQLENSIIEIITNNIFVMMAEEVYLSIISDKEVSLHIRSNAAYLLAQIWEHRIDCGVKEFAPLLNNIWGARKKLKPTFGTMLGISELFLLSENSDPNLIEFLQKEDLKNDEIESLQEFLMGLTYEEMEYLKKIMETTGRTSLNNNDINEILGDKRIYPEYETDDPRELYRSFRHREKNALFRVRASVVGPKKTIEEYIMCYLLSRPSKWIQT